MKKAKRDKSGRIGKRNLRNEQLTKQVLSLAKANAKLQKYHDWAEREMMERMVDRKEAEQWKKVAEQQKEFYSHDREDDYLGRVRLLELVAGMRELLQRFAPLGKEKRK